MIEIREYSDVLGRNFFERWLKTQDVMTKTRISVALGRVEAGNLSSLKSLGAGLSEIRLDFGPGYRLYCGMDGDALVILLGGGTKRRQQADIEEAGLLWQEYKRRKGKRSCR